MPASPTCACSPAAKACPIRPTCSGRSACGSSSSSWRAEADFLIFDTPPLLAVTDAQIAGRLVDGALLVVNSQKTSAGAVHRALEALAQVNVPVMGAVLNRLSGAGRAYYYYYHYYSHDYYRDAATDTTRGATRRIGAEERTSEAPKVLEPLSSDV